MNRLLNNKGFTLVELAVSLVVIGLLVGLGTAMVGPLMTAIKVRESKENLGAAIESANSWASGNNQLPDTTTGTTGFKSVVRTPTDAWGRDFIYLYDPLLQSATPTKDTICGRKTTRITVRQCLTANCATTAGTDYVDTPNVAYIIFSRGDDATIQTTSSDAAVTVSRSFTTGATARVTLDVNNSDIVRWVTLDELRTKVGCQGAQLKIVNNELPPATVGSPYPFTATSLAFVTDGGATPGTLRWCVEAPSATPLPAGLAFTPLLTGAIRVAPNTCNGTTPLAEASWISSATLTISGTPAANTQGAYSFVLYVRDNNDATGNNDNVASKSFVLTINP